MLSSLACRAGAFAPLLRCGINNRAAVFVSVRLASSDSELAKHATNWDKANAIYYGPERDLKNFPVMKQEAVNPPVRLGFIPETFFQFFYDKTGVTGPYLFGLGTLTFLFSKEIWVAEHNFAEFIAFWAAMVIVVKKFGPAISKMCTDDHDRYFEKFWYGRIRNSRSQATDAIAHFEKDIAAQEGQKYIFEAKRENVDLQLESAYRQQLMEVYKETKKRLDYQMSLQNARRNYEQKHMVAWIVDSVLKGITPQQEKESINKCIEDLKAIQTRTPAI